MALAAAIVRGTAALPATQHSGRGGAEGDGTAGGIAGTASEPAKPLALAQTQLGSGQRLPSDRLGLRGESVLVEDSDMLSGNSVGGGSDGAGDGALRDGRQHGFQTGVGHSAGAGADGGARASAEGRAGGEGAAAALVQGGPEEDRDRAESLMGSVTEALTPERNAALLKVRHLKICVYLQTAVD